ncbi:MAG: HNH endonuclease [Rhodocyclales bacterium]|nr:HNH endonuclease [Rhodocyclales bacterium]
MEKTPYSRTPASAGREKLMRLEAPFVLRRAGYEVLSDRFSRGMQFITARSNIGKEVTAWVKCAWHPGSHGHCAVQLDFPPPDKRPTNDEDAIKLIVEKALRASSRGASDVLLLAADEKVTCILAAYLMPLDQMEAVMRKAMAVDHRLVRNGHSPSLYVVAHHGARAEIVNVVRQYSCDLLRIIPTPIFDDDAIDDLSATPRGQEQPTRLTTNCQRFRRDLEIREYVLNRANGHCELCGKLGFVTSTGDQYLEAHHIISLAKQGPDTLGNVIALCPEHHRQAHYGADAKELEAKMLHILDEKVK